MTAPAGPSIDIHQDGLWLVLDVTGLEPGKRYSSSFQVGDDEKNSPDAYHAGVSGPPAGGDGPDDEPALAGVTRFQIPAAIATRGHRGTFQWWLHDPPDRFSRDVTVIDDFQFKATIQV